MGVLPGPLTQGVAVKGRSGGSLPAQDPLLASPRGWGADGSSSLGPSEARSAGAMCLTLAARPGPAARLWTGRLSHPGLQFSPLRNGRNAGPTSQSCRMPGTPGRRARGGDKGIGGLVGGSCRGGAYLGHQGHAPPLADCRGPQLQRLAGGPPGGLSNSAAWGPGTRGPPTHGQYLSRGPRAG